MHNRADQLKPTEISANITMRERAGRIVSLLPFCLPRVVPVASYDPLAFSLHFLFDTSTVAIQLQGTPLDNLTALPDQDRDGRVASMSHLGPQEASST